MPTPCPLTEADIILRTRHDCTYVPVNVVGNYAYVEWACIDVMNLKEPFYRLERRRRMLNTSVQFLMDYADSLTVPHPPSALIMHMSRCGSTLASRMLASLPSLVVLQEPNLIANLLEADCSMHSLPLRLVRSVYRTHAALPARRGRRMVIKLRTLSPELLDMPLRCARAAFPSTPMYFVHRDPMATWESNVRRVPPMHAFFPLALYASGNASDDDARAAAEHIARSVAANVAGILHNVLDYFHLAASQGDQEPMRLLHYGTLRDDVRSLVFNRLKLNATADDFRAMDDVATSHSHLKADGTRMTTRREGADRVALLRRREWQHALMVMGAPYDGIVALQRAQDARDQGQTLPSVPVILEPGAGCASLVPVHELADAQLAAALAQAVRCSTTTVLTPWLAAASCVSHLQLITCCSSQFEKALLKLAAIDSVLPTSWRPNPRLNSIHLAKDLTHDLIRTCVKGGLSGRPCTLLVREHRLLNHMQRHAREMIELDAAICCLNRAINIALLALFTTEDPHQFAELLLAMSLQALGIWATHAASIILPVVLHQRVCLRSSVPVFAHVISYFLRVALGNSLPPRLSRLLQWTQEVICGTLNPLVLPVNTLCATRDLDTVLNMTSDAEDDHLQRAIRLWHVCKESKQKHRTVAAELAMFKHSLSETLRQLPALTSAAEQASNNDGKRHDGYAAYFLYHAASTAWQSYQWLRRNHPQVALRHREAFDVVMARAKPLRAWGTAQHPSGVLAHWLPAYPWWPLERRHPSVDMARELLASGFDAPRAEWRAWSSIGGPARLPTLDDRWTLINGGYGISSWAETNETIDQRSSIVWTEDVLLARAEDLHGPRALAKHFPATVALVRAVDAVAHVSKASFSVLQPGGSIKPHNGNNNLAARHMLVIDDGCGTTPAPCAFLRVGNESRALHPAGAVFTFDDSFEHEVWHRGTEARVVLLLEVLHPHLLECDANTSVCHPSADALERLSYSSVYSCVDGPGYPSGVHDEQRAAAWKANWAT